MCGFLTLTLNMKPSHRRSAGRSETWNDRSRVIPWLYEFQIRTL